MAPREYYEEEEVTVRHYIHHVSGRLRIKSPVVKCDKAAATEIVRLLQSQVGIKSVEASVLTGSCLIHYDPVMTSQDNLVSLLSREGYFNPSDAITNDDYFREGAEKFISFLAAFV